MSISMRSGIRFMAFRFVLLAFCMPLAAQQTGPRIVFTDLGNMVTGYSTIKLHANPIEGTREFGG